MPVRLASLVAAFWLCAGGALAQSCNFAISNINFGNLNLGLGGTPPTSGTFTAQCSGLPNSTITICPNLGDGTGASVSGSPRLMKSGGSSVPYNFYQPNGQIWGSYVWPYSPRPPIFSLALDGNGNGSLSQNIDAAITGLAAASVPGTYTSIYSAGHTLIDYGYAPSQSCTQVSTRAARPAFTVSAQNNASCNVSATTMNFGTIGALNSDQLASNQIGITCTTGVRYAVGLSLGVNGGTSPQARFMKNPANGQTIVYGIYQNAQHTQPWGATTGTDTQPGTANGLTQNFAAYGVLPTQATPGSGAYSDTVVITVTY